MLYWSTEIPSSVEKDALDLGIIPNLVNRQASIHRWEVLKEALINSQCKSVSHCNRNPGPLGWIETSVILRETPTSNNLMAKATSSEPQTSRHECMLNWALPTSMTKVGLSTAGSRLFFNTRHPYYWSLTDSAESKLGREHRSNGGAAGAVVTDDELLQRDRVLLCNLTQDHGRWCGGGISLLQTKNKDVHVSKTKARMKGSGISG